MTITQLEYIVAIDTYKSFGLAADACFVTQPTLSMQVQKLEEQLGVKLFDRSKQPVVPTEQGEAIVEQARTVLQEVSRLKELVHDQKDKLEGSIHIGIIPTLAPYLLPLFIPDWLTSYPNVTLTIGEYTTDDIIHKLKKGQIDVGILATPLLNATLKEQPLFYEPFVAYVSHKHRLFDQKKVQQKEINQQDTWVLNEGHCFRNQVLQLCAIQDEQSSKTLKYESGSLETLKRMVDIDSGVTLLPALAIQSFTDAEMERVRYFVDPEPAREISIVTYRFALKRKLLDALSKKIIQAIPVEMKTAEGKAVIGV